VIFAAGDAWGQILEWLQGIIIPDWNGLIALLPIFVILGLTGPLLTLLANFALVAILVVFMLALAAVAVYGKPLEKGLLPDIELPDKATVDNDLALLKAVIPVIGAIFGQILSGGFYG